MSRKSKVFIAMSGGIDSSVAAFLLQKQGYNCVGVFMRCYNLDGCAEKDAEDARRAAEHIGIPFYIFDFEKEYKKKVVEYMIYGYKKGITPNPDVMCNKEIKFGLFLKRAMELGADYVTTGHYVRLATSHWGIGYSKNKKEKLLNSIDYTLLAACDTNKDQSYFLWTLTQDQLKHCLFPIGDYLKSEVREIARKAKLPTAEKKDSQGICFLGKVGIKDFLKNYIKPKRGDVLDVEGRKIGEHEGAQFYTIGQRHINMKFQISSASWRTKFQIHNNRKPLYVVDKDIKTNTVIVAEDIKKSVLYKKEIFFQNVHFINIEYTNILENVGMLKILVRVRYRQPLVLAAIYKLSTTHYKLIFNESQKFIAPGQSAVFYSKSGELMGGGVIC